MKNAGTKILRDRFAPWYYQAETEQLNALSRDGWQLSARKIWRMEFVRDSAAQYRYAIDFRRGHDEARYLDTFREMGWELVSSIGDAVPLPWDGYYWGFTPGSRPADGRWYFFRKAYDPALPDAAYSIDPDPATMMANKKRLASVTTARVWLWGAVAVLTAVLCWLDSLLGQSLTTAHLAGVTVPLSLAAVSLYQRRQFLSSAAPPKRRIRLWPVFIAYLLAAAVFRLSGLTADLADLAADTGMSASLFLIPAGLALLTAALIFLPPLLRPGKNRLALDRSAVVIPLTVYCLSFLFMGFMGISQKTAARMPAITGANTPAKLFLALTPDTTMAQVNDAIAENGWGGSAGDTADTSYITHMHTYRSIVTVPAEGGNLSYSAHQEQNGVIVALQFYGGMLAGYESEAPEGVAPYDLIAARLTVKTGSGDATCYYYPTSYTEYGRAQGFTVETKSAWYSPKKIRVAATAQEAVDMAYAAVYPG